MTSSKTLQMLRYIADNGEVPLHVLLKLFWPEADEAEGARSVRRWVDRQRRTNLVTTSPERAMATTVRLTKPGAARFEQAVSPAVVGHVRAREHHAATLRFVEVVKARLGPNERVVDGMLEPELRARVQAGKATKRGQVYDSFPDFVLVVETMLPDGSTTTRRVAIEYVTSKYTSQDIKDKDESFNANYDEVLWVGDSVRTKQRVERLTQQECAWLA